MKEGLSKQLAEYYTEAQQWRIPLYFHIRVAMVLHRAVLVTVAMASYCNYPHCTLLSKLAPWLE